jgi:hypothetical protein
VSGAQLIVTPLMAGTFYFFSAGASAHNRLRYVTELKRITTSFYGLRRLPDAASRIITATAFSYARYRLN